MNINLNREELEFLCDMLDWGEIEMDIDDQVMLEAVELRSKIIHALKKINRQEKKSIITFEQHEENERKKMEKQKQP